MKKIRSLLLFGLALPLHGADITWSSGPTSITDDSDISLTGTLVYANSWGDAAAASITVGGETIDFALNDNANASVTKSGQNSGGDRYNTADTTSSPEFVGILNSFAYDGANPKVLTLNNLVVGKTYQIQIFVSDDRACCSGRTQLWSDNNTLGAGLETSVFAHGDSPFVIGSFVAQSVTEMIYGHGVDQGQSLINAFILRETAAAPDDDDDGLPDSWEEANGLSTSDDGSTDINQGPDGDPDNDDSTNLDEFQRGTDPNDSDTDEDGFYDGAETKTGMFVSYDRIANTGDTGTDPLKADTDGDTLLDGVETGSSTYVDSTDTGTDPNKFDTDGDGLPDNAELPPARDPNDPNDGPSGLALGLVSYWNFDAGLTDIAHSELFTDSGSADDGIFVGTEGDSVISSEGLFGGALQQNGGDAHVEVTASVDTLRGTSDSITVSSWFKVTAFDSNWQTLLSHGEGSQWRIARRSEEPTLSYAGGAGDIPGANTGPNVDDGEWHHLVAISDPDQGLTSLYIDGALVGTGGAPNIQDTNNDEIPDLWIGANPQSVNREWNGFIDDLAIWNRPLSEDEIASIYNEGTGASVLNLLGGGDIEINSIVLQDDQISLTWNSTAGATYNIYASTDLVNWDAEVADGITGESGTTTWTFTNPTPDQTKLFFRVEPPRQAE